MGSKWEEKTLEELTDLIVDCPHSTPRWSLEGEIVLRNQNIRNGRLDLTSPSYTNTADYSSRIKRATPTAGDVVFTREAPMGEACIIPPRLKCCLGQRMVLIRTNRKLIPKFLLYTLQGPYLQHQIGWNEGTGTTVSNIRIPYIKKFSIPLPPLPEQKAIAHILGSLDDKIEINRQMNETLEGMAQALFKSWFVDFDPVMDNALTAGNPIPEALAARAEIRRQVLAQGAANREAAKPFPSAFQFTEEMGWIPEGWEVQALSMAIHVNPSVKLAKGYIAPFVDMKALPTNGFSITNVIKKAYTGGVKFQKNDVLLARITPCLENGKTGLVDFLPCSKDVGFGSTEFIVLRGKGVISYPFIACLSRNERFRNHCIQSMVGSSGRQRIQNACFDSFFISTTEKPFVINMFTDIAQHIFHKIKRHSNESQTLTNLRDTLLPKLISGELRIPEAEKLVDEALA